MILDFEVAIGSYVSRQIGALTGTLTLSYFGIDINPGSVQDSYRLTAFSGPDAPSLSPIFVMGLVADTPGVNPDLDLPVAPPALAELRPFSIADWEFPGLVGTGIQLYGAPDRSILVELTRLEAVPEPGFLAFVAIAAIALARRPRRQPD